MAQLPDVSISILDGALGIQAPSTAKTQLKIGPSPKGLINTVQSIGDSTSLSSVFGKGGPLAEAIALVLQAAGGPVYGVAVNPSTYGTPGTVTKTVSGGASALTVTAKPFQALKVKCAVGGTLGVATLQLSTDGGASYGAAFVSAATVMLPGASFVTIACGVGTYVAGDTWDIATDGTVTLAGTGINGVTLSSSCPVDGYSLIVQVVTAGALGVGTFKYTLDNGVTWSGEILSVASGKYVIPDTGVLLTLSGTLVASETWTCTVATASYTTTDLTNAFNAALADPRTWGFVHVVGPAATVGAAATLTTTLDSLLTSAASQYRYARGIVEVPTDTDGNTATAFAAVGATRTLAAVGFAYVSSPLNGRVQLRSAAWPVAARAGLIPVSEDLGRTARGALTGVSLTATTAAGVALAKQRDENSTPGLDASRFTTLRTIIGRQGIYITKGRTMAPSGSDYSVWQNGRVIDVASAQTRDTMLSYLNASLVLKTDGTISEREAQGIEGNLDSALQAALTQPGDASAVVAIVNRTTSIVATSTLPVSVRVTPLGYASYINVDLGFFIAKS
jgi:hypothetical protein